MDVIYLSGGKGIRAGLGYPKQFAKLGGKPILIHGLEILEKMPEITKIIIPATDEEATRVLMETYQITKAVVVPGGQSRQESVCIGLRSVTTEYVLVAEAVRPFITEEFVRRIIEYKSDFLTPIQKPVASVILTGGGYISRDKIGEVQMPQKYKTEILRAAHEETMMKNASDDAVLVIEMLCMKPTIIEGIQQNIKITTPLDLRIAEAIYESNHNRE